MWEYPGVKYSCMFWRSQAQRLISLIFSTFLTNRKNAENPLIFHTEYLIVFETNVGHFTLLFFSTGLKSVRKNLSDLRFDEKLESDEKKLPSSLEKTVDSKSFTELFRERTPS